MREILAALNDIITTLEDDNLVAEAAEVQQVFDKLAGDLIEEDGE